MNNQKVSTNKPTSWIQAVRSDFIPENLRWVYDDPRAFKFAFELASRASRNERYVEHRGQRIPLRPREFIVGRFKTAEKLGFTPSEFRNYLRKFENHAIIKTISATKRHTKGMWLGDELFYINPIGEKPSEQPSELPSSRHQNAIRVATNKEVKKVKNVKNVIYTNKYSSLKDITEEDLTEISESYKVSLGFVKLQFEKLQNYCESRGKSYKDYRAALRTFVLNGIKEGLERRSQDATKQGIDARGIE